MNIIIDQGNSTTKISIFNNDELKEHFIEKDLSFNKIQKLSGHTDKCIFSTVTKTDHDIINRLQNNFSQFIFLDHLTPMPIKVLYKTSETLGKDRLAGAVGAHKLYPENNVLIIDAGTAITYDIKTAEGKYAGGNISPGLSLRYRALHEYTVKLPLLEIKENFNDFGDDTNSAITCGVQNGILYEVEQTIEKAENKYNDLKVIITGGDTIFFDNNIKKSIFVVQNLVAIGLNTILEYNAD